MQMRDFFITNMFNQRISHIFLFHNFPRIVFAIRMVDSMLIIYLHRIVAEVDCITYFTSYRGMLAALEVVIIFLCVDIFGECDY